MRACVRVTRPWGRGERLRVGDHRMPVGNCGLRGGFAGWPRASELLGETCRAVQVSRRKT
eukprot:688705-Prymnesium_polylepis.2